MLLWVIPCAPLGQSLHLRLDTQCMTASCRLLHVTSSWSQHLASSGGCQCVCTPSCDKFLVATSGKQWWVSMCVHSTSPAIFSCLPKRWCLSTCFLCLVGRSLSFIAIASWPSNRNGAVHGSFAFSNNKWEMAFWVQAHAVRTEQHSSASLGGFAGNLTAKIFQSERPSLFLGSTNQ